METVLAFVIGGLYAMGLYLMMRRSIVKLIIGWRYWQMPLTC
jgi:multisubunit Na+/H+ antiporter MnhC subunit